MADSPDQGQLNTQKRYICYERNEEHIPYDSLFARNPAPRNHFATQHNATQRNATQRQT